MRRLFLIAAIVGLMAPATASTVYSNFAPGNGYSCCAGYPVGGAAGFFGQMTEAVEFHSGFHTSVHQIDLALGYVDGANSAVVSLWTESAGLPGAMLGSWTVAGLPASGTPNAPTSITSISGITLSAGADYFLVVGPLSTTNDTAVLWSLNDIGAIGFVPTDFGAGWDPSGSYEILEPTFAIFGTGGTPSVPEPASWALMLGAIAGAVRLHRRSAAK